MPSSSDPSSPSSSRALLGLLGSRVRDARRGLGWTRDELAGRCGLSVRFLARIENGDGNVSVLRLEALARALGTTPDRLLRPTATPSPIVSLVGMRGAGKSTVGPLVARRLGRRFIEMDQLVVDAAGLELDELFELHGEAYYRRLERDALQRILDLGEPAVLAAAGGLVNAPESWELLLERSAVVWLRAKPEEHWDRVVAQGDRRPMADNPDAMDDLRALLASREPLYRRAPLALDTDGRTPDRIAAMIVDHVGSIAGSHGEG